MIRPVMTEKAILKEKLQSSFFLLWEKRYDNSYVFRHLAELVNYKVVKMKNLKAFSDEVIEIAFRMAKQNHDQN